MPFISARAAAHKDYDVIVVGSGAGGGQIAYTLTMEGVRVLMLEAGRKYDASEAAMFQTPDVAPLRGMDTPDKNFGFYDATVDGGWQVPGEPYMCRDWRGRDAVQMVAVADARRADQPLGADLVAQWPL